MKWLLALTAFGGAFVTDAGSGSEIWQTIPAPAAMPALSMQGRVQHDGAQIWFASVGAGSPITLLHGGLGSSDDWGNQVPALVSSKHRVILIDSRGQGRSTRDGRPMSYELMESDVLAVLNELNITKTAVVGWSDGGIIALIMAMKHPSRVTRVFAFAAHMDHHGIKSDAVSNPIVPQFSAYAKTQYARLSPTPNDFDSFSKAMETMFDTQLHYTTIDLEHIRGSAIAIADGDHEEFIAREHTQYLARTIAGARLIMLKGVSHFAPWQDPGQFNEAMLRFLGSGTAAP